MTFRFSIIALFSLGLFLSACGAPSQERISQTTQLVNTVSVEQAVVARRTGFGGSAVPINIFVDGVKVASLSSNETEAFSVPAGDRKIEARFTGPAALTTKPAVLQFSKKSDEPVFFSVSMRTGLIGASLQISQVSANSLNAF